MEIFLEDVKSSIKRELEGIQKSVVRLRTDHNKLKEWVKVLESSSLSTGARSVGAERLFVGLSGEVIIIIIINYHSS